MKPFLCSVFFVCLINQIVYSQNAGQAWLETGIQTKLNKGFSVKAELNNRFGSNGLATSFTQLTAKYKVISWLSASIDYRLISKKEQNGNYLLSNRVNSNLSFSYRQDRFSAGLRIRYQRAFNRLNASSYEPDFDNAFRFRPKVKYDIENSIFTPNAAIEFYYNPDNGEFGKQFNKIRTNIGVELELDGPHSVGINLLYDKKINLPNPTNYLIFKLAYSYKLALTKKSNRR